jgi:hypothetical protein
MGAQPTLARDGFFLVWYFINTTFTSEIYTGGLVKTDSFGNGCDMQTAGWGQEGGTGFTVTKTNENFNTVSSCPPVNSSLQRTYTSVTNEIICS